MADSVKSLRDDLDELARRVEHLENQTGVRTPEQVEQDQADRDAEILSRFPTNHDEAVAYEAAKERQARRETDSAPQDDEPDDRAPADD